MKWISSSLSFELLKGEMLLLQTENESDISKLIECLMGLNPGWKPMVKINGLLWSQLNPYEQTFLRGQIRILHKTNPFINNLDLYENISLSLKHHEHLSDSEIMISLNPYLSLFNANSFLKLRPCEATETQLKLAQWIRLFIGSPMLLILQCPELHTPGDFLSPIETFIKKIQDSGGGIIYINSGEPIVFESLITKRYIIKNSESLLKSEVSDESL